MGWILAWAQPAEPEVVQPDDALVQANEDLSRIRAIDDVDLGAGLVGGVGALSQPGGRPLVHLQRLHLRGDDPMARELEVMVDRDLSTMSPPCSSCQRSLSGMARRSSQLLTPPAPQAPSPRPWSSARTLSRASRRIIASRARRSSSGSPRGSSAGTGFGRPRSSSATKVK